MKDKDRIAQILKQVGILLRKSRREKGHNSYENFAVRNGISRSSLLGYENGKNMQLDTLLHILGILNIGVAEFFEPINNMTIELYPELGDEEE